MKFTLTAFLILFSVKSSAQINSSSIVGLWVDAVSKNMFEIEKNEQSYTIKIVALTNPLNDKGQPKSDQRNPDEKLRNLPILGMNIASGIIFDNKTSTWSGKEIYSPEKGMTASFVISLKDSKHLSLVASKYFIKMEKNWVRYEK